MKHWLFCLLLGAMLWALPSAAQAEGAIPGFLRLQIIANSNDEIDQQVKLKVRDSVMECVQETFLQCTDAENAYNMAQKYCSRFEESAKCVLLNMGIGHEVSANVGEYCFQDRVYNGIRFPAGKYRTLRITIGEGNGRNWWCVLYPTLWEDGNEMVAEDTPVTFFSSTWRFLKHLFGGDAA